MIAPNSSIRSQTNGIEASSPRETSEHSGKPAPIRLACTTVYDARDPNDFMGSRTVHQLRAIESQVEAMRFVGPLSVVRPVAPWLFAKREFYGRVRKKSYHPKRDQLRVKDQSRQIAQQLAKLDVDVVLSPMSPGSQPVAYLECEQPIVIWTDATWAAAVDFYPEYRSDEICEETLCDAIENERAALSRASLAIYYSDWAADSAIHLYGLDAKKVRVISPGPAFSDEYGLGITEAKRVVRSRSREVCRLLYVGSPWERKGGDTALDVAKLLNARNIPAELVVVGCQPPADDPLPDFVHVIERINRSTEAGAAAFKELFESCHFMFVPSRAEAFGLIFAEATAFALPSISTNVGGIPSAIRSGVNGATFPLSTSPFQYCAYIEDLFTRYELYEQLAFSTLTEFHTRLNNRTAASSVVRAMTELLH